MPGQAAQQPERPSVQEPTKLQYQEPEDLNTPGAGPYPEPEPYYEPEPHRGRERYREPEPYRDDPYHDRYDDRYRDRDRYEEHERYRGRGDALRGPSADTIGRIIQVATALIALIFVLHIVFSVSGANQSNGFVSFVYGMAKVFVLGLGDVFTPGDATIGLILNYSLAAVIYLVLGRIIARALRR